MGKTIAIVLSLALVPTLALSDPGRGKGPKPFVAPNPPENAQGPIFSQGGLRGSDRSREVIAALIEAFSATTTTVTSTTR